MPAINQDAAILAGPTRDIPRRAGVADRRTRKELDADQEMVGSLFEDTTLRRRLPGEGSFDLVGFIRLLDEIGVEAPVSVEILSLEQQGYPLIEASRLAHNSSRNVIAKARG